jgi:hypothetical protein
MSRTVLEPDDIDDVLGHEVVQPTRFVFLSPLRGGPPLRDIRRALAGKGKVRFSGTPARLYADVDPGEPEAPLIALDMIARSDAEGLERAILSALPHVDEIVIGVDGRSDPETGKVVDAYADTGHVFEARHIGLTDEEWATDKMHFANARNIGRALVTAPWTLVVDTDEYIRRAVDVRAILRGPDAELFAACDVVVVTENLSGKTHHRLARTAFRWWSPSHNQLDVMGAAINMSAVPIVEIVEDKGLRTADEITRRRAQRDEGVQGLREEAAKGQVMALYHLAKHLLVYGGNDISEGVKFAEDFRLRVEVNGPFADQRVRVAMTAAFAFYNRNDFDRAAMWAVRALLDGPRPEAFCLLGDIAEDQGDLPTALSWYDAACIVPEIGDNRWHYVDRRFGRRDGLRIALGKVESVPAMSAAELAAFRGDAPPPPAPAPAPAADAAT